MERSDERLKYLDVIVYKTTSGFKTMVSSKIAERICLSQVQILGNVRPIFLSIWQEG